MTRTRALYEFGDFVLDVGQQRLLRRDTGEAIPLVGKVFDTLLYLVEHAGEPLDKDVLLHSIWPGVIVEENSLTQNVSTLRQVLGETRGENRYIATIARKGYRFVAKVTRRDEPAPTTTAETRTTSPSGCSARLRSPADRTGPSGRGTTDCRDCGHLAVFHPDRVAGTCTGCRPDPGHPALQAAVACRAQRIAGVGHDGIVDLEFGSI